jgi:aminopeptidase N
VAAAAGLPAPNFVWSNDGDYGYGLFLPDARSAQWLLEHASQIQDLLLRSMAWGALWDMVREAKLSPVDFTDRTIKAIATENDETLSNAMVGRAFTALERYISEADARQLIENAETVLLRRADDEKLPYALRKPAFDAFIRSATTTNALNTLRTYLGNTRSFNGKPIAQVSRWAIVRRLSALNTSDAHSLYQSETARDTTTDRLRSAFTAGAAFASAETKASYYARFFDDQSLNEEWVTAALGSFNEPLHANLTLPFLRPALEKSPWLRDHRRIFFLPSWLQSFIEGQNSREALQVVDAYLASAADLPIDVRRKILQSRDELERTVRIRER